MEEGGGFFLKSCLNPGVLFGLELLFLQIDYPPFEKNFYNEHEELSSLNGTQVIELRQKLNLRVRTRSVHVRVECDRVSVTLVYLSLFQVSGAAPPKPSTSFAHFGFDEQLMHQIRKSEYTQPTPIQCQVCSSGPNLSFQPLCFVI